MEPLNAYFHFLSKLKNIEDASISEIKLEVWNLSLGLFQYISIIYNIWHKKAEQETIKYVLSCSAIILWQLMLAFLSCLR